MLSNVTGPVVIQASPTTAVIVVAVVGGLVLLCLLMVALIAIKQRRKLDLSAKITKDSAECRLTVDEEDRVYLDILAKQQWLLDNITEDAPARVEKVKDSGKLS